MFKKNVDYIVVGCGLAGIAFCEQLKSHNKSFFVFDDGSQQSSTVAGGLYNPVVLKRFTPVWNSKQQLDIALPFYQSLEKKFKTQFDIKIPVLRLFHSIEEQNNWFTASDKEGLSEWMSTSIIPNTNPFIKADLGSGEVLHTGRVDTSNLIQCYIEDLQQKDLFFSERFDYNSLIQAPDNLVYKGIKAKNIVFAEGFGLKQNPFFNHLPLTGTKGELLIIHAPQLKLDVVIKSSVFLIPLQNDKYIVGATYNWKDKTNLPTKEAKDQLLAKLETVIGCDYKVIDHIAAIRPTVKDRRPLVGRHHIHNNIFILNGLGTRGVMIAPYIADKLFNSIENNEPLDKEINCNRFNQCITS